MEVHMFRLGPRGRVSVLLVVGVVLGFSSSCVSERSQPHPLAGEPRFLEEADAGSEHCTLSDAAFCDCGSATIDPADEPGVLEPGTLDPGTLEEGTPDAGTPDADALDAGTFYA